MKLSWVERKKRSSSLLLTSLLNLPCLFPHTLTTSMLKHTHTHTRCICFVVDLPPPDCECCGLLQQHRYYGIVTGCDENRHKQWWELNENKDPCMGAKKKGHKHKRFLYLVLAHTSFYAQLLYTVCTVYMPVSSKLLMPVIISPRSVLPCVGSTTANNSNPSQEHNLAPVQYNCILFIFMHLFRGILFYVSMFWYDYLLTLLWCNAI